MAKVYFLIEDNEDGQSVTCECRSSDVEQKDSHANIIGNYIADNWVGLVQAARLAHNQAVLREAASLQREVEPVKTTGLVDASGSPWPPQREH